MSRWPFRSRRAKQSVLAGVGLFLTLQLGMNVVLDTFKPEWRDPEYGHRMKDLRKQAKANPKRPVVVVLGSSRSEMGFNPIAMERRTGTPNAATTPIIYNCSQAGCGPLYELLNLQRLLADGVRPNFVLVEILPPVLAGRADAEKLIPITHLSCADVRRVEPYCTNPRSLWLEWTHNRLVPWNTYRLSLLSNWGSGSLLPWQARQDFMWKQMKPNGWLPYFFEEIPGSRRENGIVKARAEYLPYFNKFEIAPLADRCYRDLIALAQSHGIAVAFFTMPESPIFRSWYPEPVRQQLNQYYASLTREHGTPVFVTADWVTEETAFADGHHLMRHGAEAFSERFGEQCLHPWLEAKR